MAFSMQLKSMAQREEQQSRCSDNSNGGRAIVGGKKPLNKTNKKKKVPQRGPGVAQLEKILLEDQQKNDAASSYPQKSSTLYSNTTSIASNSHLNKSSVPISSPIIDLISPESSLSPEAPKVDASYDTLVSSPVCIPRFDQFNDSCSKRLALAPTVPQKRQQPPPASLVNRMASTSYYGINLQVPWNGNSCRYHSLPTSWSKEDSMVGMKRQGSPHIDHECDYFFFPHEIPQFNSPLIQSGSYLMEGEAKDKGIRDNNLSFTENQVYSNCSNFRLVKRIKDNVISMYGGHPSVDYSLKPIVECHLNSKSSNVHFNRGVKEKGVAMDGDHLSSSSSLAPSVDKAQQSMAIPSSHHYNHGALNSTPNEGTMDNSVWQFGSRQQQPFYYFFPMGPKTSEASDGIDLELKL